MGRRRSDGLPAGSPARGKRGERSSERTRSVTSGDRISSSLTVATLHAAKPIGIRAKPTEVCKPLSTWDPSNNTPAKVPYRLRWWDGKLDPAAPDTQRSVKQLKAVYDRNNRL